MRWVPNPCRNMVQGSTAISSRSPLSFPFCPLRTSRCRLTLSSPALLCLRPGHAHSIAVSLIALRRLSGATAKASLPKQQQVEEEEIRGGEESVPWDKVSAVLFDMDGVLCNSEELSRMAAVDLFADMGVSVTADDFISFIGTGEANFLGGVASMKGVKDFDPQEAKKQFLEIYVNKYAMPNLGIGYPGALELIMECKRRGLKVAITSSADRTKVDANLAAAGLPVSLFDVIISADAFEKLKPAPDIFIAASKSLDVPQSQCIVIESALAGVEAAKAAKMRCIAVTTTISVEMLQKASPSLVRKDIGSISIDDILHGGHSFDQNKKVEETCEIGSSNGTSTSSGLAEEVISGIVQDVNSASEKNHYHGGLQGSRRQILRYGSLGIAITCLLFTASNWKIMQYASLKGLVNLFTGVGQPNFRNNNGNSRSLRIQQIKNYLSDMEIRGSALDMPEFPSKLEWLNTAPLQFRRNLKGRVVLLDFWTYCCINCMHVLPELEFLEKKYADKPFTVVGVHSAKFDNEKDLEAIRSAVLRYNISHPVVNDGNMYLWRELGVNSWPTFVVVSPTGKVLLQISGEGHREDLDNFIDAALQFYGEKKLLENTVIPLSLEKDNDPRLLSSPLKFPGKLAIDELNNRLFISDSNHNRIVVTDLDGNFIVQVGATGEDGLNDGNFDSATFSRPQGLAYNPKKNLLYVADTENHALRVIDFVNDTVRTLAGNGTKGSDYDGGERGTNQVLNSPWDLCYEPSSETVYIAMAGQHQIWEYNTSNGVAKAFSGDGYEKNLNGSSPKSTSFAQPSGITLAPDLQEVYVADSESSSIRAVDLKTGGSRLLAGGDPLFPDNLFRFGDHDGVGSDVLLQHPLGVFCGRDGQIYIADSYNHKIKKLDPTTRKVTTLAGTGNAGFKDGPSQLAQLSEPSGIVETGQGKLLIADTNNNIIRYIDLNEKDPVMYTLELRGVQPPSSKSKLPKRLRRRLSADTDIVKIDGGTSMEGIFNLTVLVPEGYHFSKEARSKFDVETDPTNAINIEPVNGNLSPEGSASLKFRRNSPSAVMGRINCKIYYCKEDEVCLYQSVAFDVSFREELESTQQEVKISYTVTPKALSGASPMILSK